MSTPVDRQGGAIAVGHMYGEPSAPNKYYKSASVILAVGDPVALTGTGEGTTAVPQITRAAAGDRLVGFVVGIVPNINNKRRYMAAADAGYVLVADDPNTVFEIAEDGDSSQLAITALGGFADLVVTDADTSNGVSKVELDSSSIGTSNGQVRLIRRLEKADNDLGNVGTRWLVTINEHYYKSAQTGV